MVASVSASAEEVVEYLFSSPLPPFSAGGPSLLRAQQEVKNKKNEKVNLSSFLVCAPPLRRKEGEKEEVVAGQGGRRELWERKRGGVEDEILHSFRTASLALFFPLLSSFSSHFPPPHSGSPCLGN